MSGCVLTFKVLCWTQLLLVADKRHSLWSADMKCPRQTARHVTLNSGLKIRWRYETENGTFDRFWCLFIQ